MSHMYSNVSCVFPNLDNVLKKIHVLYGLSPNRFIVSCTRSEII